MSRSRALVSLLTLMPLLVLPVMGCDSPPDRFKLEDTQFVHAFRNAGLTLELNAYVPEGETVASADHAIVLGTPRALSGDAPADVVIELLTQGYLQKTMSIGYVDKETLTICAAGQNKGKPVKVVSVAFRKDDAWATLGEVNTLDPNWQDAPASDVCSDAAAEGAALLELGKVLIDA